jgi:hypothetical protein
LVEENGMPIAEDDVKLPAGKELEATMRLVDLREYLPMIDFIRSSPESAQRFITKIAMIDPLFFKRVFRLIKLGDVQEDLDTLIRANQIIPAVKMIREKLNLGLREAKQMYDTRKAELGL